MSSLYKDFETLVPKLAGLTAGVIAERQLDINNMIASPGDNEVVKSLKLAGMLRVAEFIGDYMISMATGGTPPSLTNIIQLSTAEEVAAIGGALYVIEKMGLEDQIVRFTGDNEILKSVALSVVYMVAQESVALVTPMVLKMV